MRLVAKILFIAMMTSALGGTSSLEAAPVTTQLVTDVQRAVDERRFLDANAILERAALQGVEDPRLSLLWGELELRRGHADLAVADFKLAAGEPALRSAALQGQGIALSLLGRSDEALSTLEAAVKAGPTAWRAWNALGAEYDNRRDWSRAADAYQRAHDTSKGAAIVLNNRGYSKLIQGQYQAAMTDFVAALHKQPDLIEARTNLRLSLAMGGDYDRSLAGGSTNDRPGLLNNAGFSAGLRGDYKQAELLLNQAIDSKGKFYGRAMANLAFIRAMIADTKIHHDTAR